mmetsp:Transcript_7329/g.15724  ORF Transcript_7329/g.15724 Transcript_7329/m.15724 type:complete len:240 (-) Transcript_7329:1799-2518(-)
MLTSSISLEFDEMTPCFLLLAASILAGGGTSGSKLGGSGRFFLRGMDDSAPLEELLRLIEVEEDELAVDDATISIPKFDSLAPIVGCPSLTELTSALSESLFSSGEGLFSPIVPLSSLVPFFGLASTPSESALSLGALFRIFNADSLVSVSRFAAKETDFPFCFLAGKVTAFLSFHLFFSFSSFFPSISVIPCSTMLSLSASKAMVSKSVSIKSPLCLAFSNCLLLPIFALYSLNFLQS